MRVLKKFSAYPYMFWSVIFVILPIVAVFIYSLTCIDGNGEIYFSFSNFADFFTNPIYINVLLRSIRVALQGTIICLALGYPVAMIIASMKPKNRNLGIMLFILPMWMNFLIRTYAMMVILGEKGWLNQLLYLLNLPLQNILFTERAIVVGMVYNFLPFMVLPIYTSLIKMDRGLLEAASDLGANRYTSFVKVVLPLTIPGIISGVTMVFMPAVSTFVISDLLGGSKIMLVGNLIQQQFLYAYNWYLGSTMSIIVMVMILVLMAVLNKASPKEEDKGGVSIS